ncbi:hypothetical protein PtA15_8A361 [Puccinia triticina]|uniref:ATP-dependent DNA helicase n=1 Tax=Puccinia triticina TaxID=208348 RepID=A0ABY7CSK9_9BASI|nr:uncharacterized protein PtA15_8A361 [Puccinia triticina]WAQ87457.1 hypothetical protein PtA15_8A361 [Puccinia triticina]
MELSSQPTRSPNSSCGAGTPTRSPAKPSHTSLQRSPSKTPMSAEVRARIEENRKRAQEIRSRKQQLERSKEQAALEANRRAAGEQYLKEFGIGSTSKQTPHSSSTNSNFKTLEELNHAIELDPNFLLQPKLPPQPYSPDPRCSEEQLKVLDLVKLGRNVFFTGSAGVGKSFMLHEVVRMLKSDKRRVSVTAPTGIAALAIGGCTIHSWAKVGLGHGSVHTIYNKLIGQKLKSERFDRDGDSNRIWNTDVLIIDEASMLHPDLFEKISILCQAIRKIKKPFGGIQIILSGDFFQLPPVTKDDDFTCMYCGCPKFERVGSSGKIRCVKPLHKKWDDKPCGRIRREYTFCFETTTWRQLNLQVIELTKVFRQEDKHFIDMLNKIRWGTVDDEIERIAVSRSQPLEAHEIKPTRLYARNLNVHSENAKQFNLLDSKPYEFSATDQTMGNASYAHTFLSRLDDLQARKKLTLKIGAQVMLLCNLDIKSRLVNGSRGVVIDWVESPSYQLSSVLSQQRDPDDMKKLYWCSKQPHRCLPKVLFSDGRVMLIEPFVWSIEIDASLTLSRTQLPLSLAWAITIHKSQGQTLDRLCVDLFGIFEHGQAYVALSRARSLDGLQITGWKSTRVQCHPSVKAFYKSLHESRRSDSQEEDFLDARDFFPFPDSIEFISGASPSPEPSPSESVFLYKRRSSNEDVLSDEDALSRERLTSFVQGADIIPDLISSDRVKSLCLKKATTINPLDGRTFIGWDSKSHSDSKLHIDPLLGGSSPTVSEDLLDDAQLISVVEEVERSQGEQPLSQSVHVDQLDQREMKGDRSNLKSPGQNQPTPETPENSEDTPSPIPKRKNQPKAEIQMTDLQSFILSRPLTKSHDRLMPTMHEIDNNRNGKSTPFTTGTNLWIPTRHMIDDPPSLPGPAINKDRSISRVKATKNNQCIETLLLSRGQHQMSSEIQTIVENQLDIPLPIKKTQAKRKLSEYEGIALSDDKPFSKRANTTPKNPLPCKDEADYRQSSCPTNLIPGPSNFDRANPGSFCFKNGRSDLPGHANSDITIMSINHQSRSNVDSKPNRNQDDTIAIESDPQTPFVEQDFAKTMLNDFTRRIQNSIFRLNKSLLDLPPGHYAREFDLDSVEEHVRMLVAQNFYNPHLDNGAAPTVNEPPSRGIGHTPNLEATVVKEDDLLSKENNPNTDETLTNTKDTTQLDRKANHNPLLENDIIDDVFRQIPPDFQYSSFHFPF